MNRIPNALAGSISPYLLQHAYNPVQWFPWSEDVLLRAKRENKPLIISIGYSACHWCHVMEHESFESEDVAAIMNRGFISIKIDREERPDIDQVYMDAVQLMSGRGGWPLNVIALPDGRPIYGGTYFPRDQWMDVLLQIERMYRNEPARCESYAEELAAGMQRLNDRFVNPSTTNSVSVPVDEILVRWKRQFDLEFGGSDRVPKFPMPDSYRYLLVAGVYCKDTEVMEHVHHSLRMMAFGGIYDQIGGGFARYSTDSAWKVPHFEKMLYDNALLISLYADAYRNSPDPLYADVIHRSIDFIYREMLSPKGGFYSALDADSEGVEGKYYCWSPNELDFLPEEDRVLACDYFNIGSRGYWEHGMHIPLRHDSDAMVAQRHGLDANAFVERIDRIRSSMLNFRSGRVRPGTDDKMLCNWNALMLTACLEAYTSTNCVRAFELANLNLSFFKAHFLSEDKKHLWHCAKEVDDRVVKSVSGFLDDYAFAIEALLQWNSVMCDMEALTLAINLAQTVLDEFYDEQSGLCFYTSIKQELVLMRKMEVSDNVIPSSNSVIAHQFSRLHRMTGSPRFAGLAERMLYVMRTEYGNQASWYSRWARLDLELAYEEEIVLTGPLAPNGSRAIHATYRPLSLICGSVYGSELPVFSGRHTEAGVRVYVCRQKTCSAPFQNTQEALAATGFPQD